MTKIIYKPQTTKGPVLLLDHDTSTPPSITLADGTVVTAKKAGQGAPGSYHTSESGSGFQWVFPSSVIGASGATLNVEGSSQQLSNTTSSWRGDSIGSLQESSNGAVGSSQGPGGGPTDLGPGYLPADLSSQYPQFQPTTYHPSQYNPVPLENPEAFGQQYGKSARADILKNYGLGKGLALDTLSTELKGLKAYAPAAANLSRELTSADNQFNQQQRTQQLGKTLPGVLSNLSGQTDRANTYAQGKLPNAQEDAALTYGIGSQAADVTASRGFGDNSLIGKSTTSLMNAQQRLEIAKYGESLIGQNAQTRSALELAPTEYANTGTQISPNPSISTSQLQNNFLNVAQQATSIPATQALQSVTQQQQFNAGNTLQNNQFNAQNTIQNDQFNSTNMFTAGLGMFNYKTGLAGTAADVLTAGKNQAREDAQRQQLLDMYNKAMSSAQGNQTITSVLGGLGSILGLANTVAGTPGANGQPATGGLANIISGIGSLFTGGGNATSTIGPLLDTGTETGGNTYAGILQGLNAGGSSSGFFSGIGDWASGAWDWIFG